MEEGLTNKKKEERRERNGERKTRGDVKRAGSKWNWQDMIWWGGGMVM
jgi:hypothetical protein